MLSASMRTQAYTAVICMAVRSLTTFPALVWPKNQMIRELVSEFVNFVQDCLEEEQKGNVSYIIPDREYFPPEGTPLL